MSLYGASRGVSPGRWVWALGIVAIGLAGLAFGDFDPGQAAPAWLPGRTLLAYAANIFLAIAGAAVLWRRTAAPAAAALGAYYIVVVAVLMDGRGILAHPTTFGAYSNLSYQLAIGAAALVLFAGCADIAPVRAARLAQAGRTIFGVCALFFGGAHFVYLNLTAPLVPEWLPPSQVFWAYATGAAHIAAGLAILTGVQARRAAILLTIMFASFTPLVHLRLLFGDPHNHFFWTENAANLALTGAAWIVADSLAPAGRSGTRFASRVRTGAA
jgi:uncharacterized membrane protein